MAPSDNDYALIIRQGTIEKGPGILGRRRARRSLPGAGHGEEMVLIDVDGSAISARRSATAGERYWGSVRGWVMVDMSDHHLPFRFGYRDPDGMAGYEIDATVTVTVSDAATVVRRKIQGVRTYVEASVRAVATGSLTHAPCAPDVDALTRLNARIGTHAETLRGLVGTELPVDGWLRMVITDLSIRFDPETATHYGNLVATDRDAELTTRTIIHQQKTSEEERKLRDAWAAYLGEQVSNPIKRAVATAAADPSVDNIRELAAKLDNDDRWQQEQFADLLSKLIDSKVVVEPDDIRTTKVIMDGLRRGLPKGNGGEARPEKAIAGEVVEGDDDADERSPRDDDDTDWDN